VSADLTEENKNLQFVPSMLHFTPKLLQLAAANPIHSKKLRETFLKNERY
jgi:hypothetical protein